MDDVGRYVKGDSIDSFVDGHAREKVVPHAEFVIVVDEILASFEASQERLPHVFDMIRVEADSTPMTVESIYRMNARLVSLDMYEAAVRTLRWVNKKREIYVLPPHIEEFQRALYQVRAADAAEPEKTIEVRVQTEPDAAPSMKRRIVKKAVKKQTTSTRKTPHGYSSYSKVNTLVTRLLRYDTYATLNDLDEAVAERNVCEEGALLESQSEKRPIRLTVYYELLGMVNEEKKKKIDMIREQKQKKRERQQAPEGQVAYFAFEALVNQILKTHDYAALSAIEDELVAHRVCGTRELVNTHRRKKYCPVELYAGLVMLLTSETTNNHPPMSREVLEILRTPREYSPEEHYHIGQMLKLPGCEGVVIEKIEKDKILVAKDKAPDALGRKNSNPQMLVENRRFEPYFQRKPSNDLDLF
ncbi:hypothetical protein ACFL3V_02550 [Nanoarchaeota archaeon]